MKRRTNDLIPIKRLCVGISLCCLITGAQAAPDFSALDKKFDVQLSLNNATLKSVVNSLNKQTDIVFSYDTSLGSVPVNNVSVNVEDENIEVILDQVFNGTNIEYRIDGQMVVLYSNRKADTPGVSGIQQSNKRVTGVVLDEFGEPVIGANVVVKGTTNGMITGFDGDFTLENVPDNAILVISYIGYEPQEVEVAGKTILNITLSEDTQKLDEIVVTALGIKRQARSIGYSTASVSGDEFTEARDLNLGNALSGKVAGVSVSGNATGAGGSSRVTIRGNASITGNNQPLYVIDGIPFDNSNFGNAGQWGGLDMGDGLNAINPDDIAEIQVLKGAAASALYGYRGGNGAILITTKTGTQKGVNIEFNNNLTFNPIYDYRDFQTVYGQGTRGVRPLSAESAKQTATSNWGETMGGGKTAVNFLGNEYDYNMKDNWGNFYRLSMTENASLGISGKSDNISYRFGISNVYDRSMLPNAGLSQQGINMNMVYDITSKLTLTVNGNYAFEKVKNRANLSDGNGNVNATLLYFANTTDVRWMKPRVDAEGNELIPSNSVYFNNPYFLQYDKSNETNRNRLTGGMTLKYDIYEWLYAQGQVTRDGYTLEFRQVQPMGAAADPGGYLNEYSRNFSEVNLNFLIGFNKKFGDFSVNATVGGNRLRNIWKQFGTNGNIKSFLVPGTWAASNVSSPMYAKSYEEYRVNSIYATADFGYKDFLFLNFTGRNDWFSTLNPDTNSYFYPSVSASFMFSEAFELPEWIYSGKLRGAFATASNGTTPYQTGLYYTTTDYQVQGQSVGMVKDGSSVPDPYLKPVQISEWEVGLNVQFFDNRLGFDFAYYTKNTKDDIAEISTSQASGFNKAIMNIGEIRNNGIELMIHGVPVRKNGFMWNTTFNIAYNNSKILYLGEGVEYLTLDGATANGDAASITNVVGSSYGQIYGYKYLRDENGNKVYDESGLPMATEQQEALGSGVYKVTGGFRNEFLYKNWSLAFLLDYKFGAKIFSGTNLNAYSNGLHKNTLEGRETGFTNTYINENGEAIQVTAEAQDYWQQIASRKITEEFVYDASFIKLRELSLGYTFPASMLKVKYVKGLSLSLVGRNLWTIMKHTPNIDPESSINNTNGQGLELNGYPTTRSIGFNLNVKF
ncbi:MAG: SusC/RagA family TonB-linked outer membrane protein [Tannerellaceae bacterium]|nr:SusC/RagA family TonB-linked outer membrane protein [Tannerellaceae bacterium]